MDPSLEMIHEVVAELPIVMRLLEQLHVAQILEDTVGTHGNTLVANTLSNGLALVVWLTYLLSVGDHRKSHMADWVSEHQGVLSRLLKVPAVPATDFSDDRLSTLLLRLADPVAWERTEAAILGQQMNVYALPPVTRVHLDSTTEYGFHTPQPGGVMQLGHSKDHRPDLAQVKLMAARLNTGQMLSCVVEAGNRADNPLYIPAIKRARKMLGQTGLLYTGDCKLANQETLAYVVAGRDFYLTTLPKRSGAAENLPAWIEALVTGTVPREIVSQTSPRSTLPCVLGTGGEFRRQREVPLRRPDGTLTAVIWEERVFVFQSATHAAQQADRLWTTVRTIAAQVQALTPPPRKGVKQFRTQEELQATITSRLAKAKVEGLLSIVLETEPWRKDQERAVVKTVTIQTEAVDARCARLGWRAFVTNAPAEQVPNAHLVTDYREAWTLERDFHQLKDRPLGIHPLWVHTDVQITGLMHLLTLAARVLFYLEQRVRDGLRQEGQGLTGLFRYRDTKPICAPTVQKLLAALAARPIILTYFNLAGHTGWHLSPCPPWVDEVIRLLGLPAETYSGLLNSS